MAITKVTTEVITGGAVTTPKIADNAISAAKIPDGTIATGHIADNAVTAAKIPDNVLTATMLPDNVILATHIPNATAPTFANTTVTGTLDVTGVISPTTHIDMPDDAYIKIGTGDDLQLYHDGSDSYISDAGTGILKIKGSEIRMQTTSGENMAIFNPDGSVQLQYDNSTKLATASGGVTVTGTLTATTLAGTLSTAAQTNITSLGTLTALTVDNIGINGETITLTGGSATGFLQTSTNVLQFGTSTNDPIKIYTNNAEVATILGNGNIGIGETSPDASLHITSNTPIISFDESDASQEYRIGSFGGTFAIYDSTDSAYRVAVDGSGYVGIGTTSPGSALHISGGNNLTSQIRFTNTAPSPDNDWTIGSYYNDQGLYFRSNDNATNVMVMLDTGYVGIGTATPGDVLELDGTNPILKIGNRIRIKADESNADAWFGIGSSLNTFKFGDADFGTSFLTIKNATGNVGIGTTAPQRGLQVGAHGSGNGEIAIGSATNGYGSILFGDSTSGSDLYDGYLQYNHSTRVMLLATSGTERVRIQSGGGISFNGDSAAANALDDYEEGTFTPSSLSIAGGSGSIAMDSSYDLLAYTKIGNRVWIQGTIKISSNSANGGRVNLNGLPFTSAAGTELSGRSIFHAQVTEGSGSQDSGFFAVVEGNSTLMQIKTYTGESITNDSAVIMVANSHLYISGSYMTA